MRPDVRARETGVVATPEQNCAIGRSQIVVEFENLVMAPDDP